MIVLYNGTDISAYVNVTACRFEEAVRQADLLDVEFDRAALWNTWGPKQDDRIEILSGAFSTGEMYLTTLTANGDRARMLAVSMPPCFREERWKCWTNLRLSQMAEQMAGRAGMKPRLYGVDDIQIGYLAQNRESDAEFLRRIGLYEGFAVKCEAGYFNLVGLEWAAARKSAVVWAVEQSEESDNFQYRARLGEQWNELTLKGARCSGYYQDTTGGHPEALVCPELRDEAQAARWTRNVCLAHNTALETVTVETELSAALNTLENAELTDAGPMTGKWSVRRAWHDLVNETSVMEMERVRA